MYEMRRIVEILQTQLPRLQSAEELVQFCYKHIAELRRLRELASIKANGRMYRLERGEYYLKKQNKHTSVALQSVLQDYLEAFEAHIASVHS